MSRKRHSTEQIISKLREAEIELSKGHSVGEVCKKLGITDQTYYRWRKEYGGIRTDVPPDNSVLLTVHSLAHHGRAEPSPLRSAPCSRSSDC